MSLAEIALRCYPARWRGRHGVEAAELAALLVRDGVSDRSIAWSYLRGAARERLTPRPGRRLTAAAAALLAVTASLGVPLSMVSASAPASAASAVRAHGTQQAAPATRVGSLLQCGGLVGETVREALPTLTTRPLAIVWVVGRTAGHSPPIGSDYVAGGRVLTRASISIRVTKNRPADHTMTDSHGRPC